MDQSSINVPDFSTGDELPLIKDENGDQVCRTLHNFFLAINLPFIVLDDANLKLEASLIIYFALSDGNT